MAYCGGSTIQIYYSPHSLSAKKACTNLQTSRASENNYLSGKVRVKTWPRNVSERKGKEETLLREKSLLRNLCQRGNGETRSYKRKPRARDTEKSGVPLWNDWNAPKGKTLY